MKIVYVEDNDQNYRLIMRMLHREPDEYDLSRAPDGESGLALVREKKPDLVLMDINLPDIDGLEVTRRLKADEAYKGIPIVALTANAMVGDQERILAAGCDAYLRKPVNRSELRTTLQKYRNGAAASTEQAPKAEEQTAVGAGAQATEEAKAAADAKDAKVS